MPRVKLATSLDSSGGVLASIDPGLHKCGVALWTDGGELLDATLVDEDRDSIHPYRGMIYAAQAHVARLARLQAVEVVLECPQVYRVSKGDPNDLIHLAMVVGGLLATVPRGKPCTTYLPRQWKGQVPKEVTEQRARARLSAAELERFNSRGALDHNTWDAVGLGLYHLRINGVRP